MRRMNLRFSEVFALLGAAVVAAAANGAPMGPSQAELDNAAQSTNAWLMTNRTYDGQRFVPLAQINAGNVAGLKQVCSYDSGVQAPAQSTPLLYEGRIYFTAGQTTVAVDAATCKEAWRHEWKPKGKILSPVNRGLAMKDGRLVRGTSDGYLIALTTAGGRLLWQRQITRYEESHYLSMPPMIVDNTIVYGTAGADWGGQGWIGAFSLRDGKELWRYNALPAPTAPGSETWGGAAAIAHGGGSFWTPVSVDRTRGLVFVPTGNPAPDFYGEERPGDNAGTNTAVALDLKTGRVAWARQFVPHDTHDWDLSQTSPLLHVTVHGRERDLVMVSGKDGRLRGVDRVNGEVLYDLAIARQEDAGKTASATPAHVCPGLLGGQEWSSSAYDPQRGLVFTPMVDWCGTVVHEAGAPVHAVGVHFYGGSITQDPIDQARGVLAAVDVASGVLRWKFEAPAPMLANVTATGGGLVFAGDLKGNLYAVATEDGKLLLQYALPGSAGGGLFTYLRDDHQYVAAMSGSVSAFFGGGKDTVKLTILGLP